jgi:hypothetical protein
MKNHTTPQGYEDEVSKRQDLVRATLLAKLGQSGPEPGKPAALRLLHAEVPIAGAESHAESSGQSALDKCHQVFRKWLGDHYDLSLIDAVMVAAAVEQFTDASDPVWLMVLSGPGNGKTESVVTLGGLNGQGKQQPRVKIESEITGPAALLSASPSKDRSETASGGLLANWESGILVIKDFTTILTMSGDRRSQLLSALREVFDGQWSRTVGQDGGYSIQWSGRIGLVAAVTGIYDQAHEVISACGDRFLIIRIDSDSDEVRMAAADKAVENIALTEQMKAELKQAVVDVVTSAADRTVESLTDDEATQIKNAANLVTRLRTAVVRERGTVVDAMPVEVPTRFTKQLVQVFRGALAIGMNRRDALALALRCAKDSVPPLRLAILDHLHKAGHRALGVKTKDIADAIDRPRNTVDRELQALEMLRVVNRDQVDEEDAHPWYWSIRPKIDPTVIGL